VAAGDLLELPVGGANRIVESGGVTVGGALQQQRQIRIGLHSGPPSRTIEDNATGDGTESSILAEQGRQLEHVAEQRPHLRLDLQ